MNGINIFFLNSEKVLMYCTGGVRCERASAYMRLCGVTDVSQLSGGIHSYQEAFPDGDGFFRGKNFVYDPRIAVSHKNLDEVIGNCRLCGVQYDDYKPQVRCRSCRMLQLVCDKCRSANKAQVPTSTDSNNCVDEKGLCELGGDEVDVICTLCTEKKGITS